MLQLALDNEVRKRVYLSMKSRQSGCFRLEIIS